MDSGYSSHINAGSASLISSNHNIAAESAAPGPAPSIPLSSEPVANEPGKVIYSATWNYTQTTTTSAERPSKARSMSDISRDEVKLFLDTARADARASAAEIGKTQAELRADLKEGMSSFSVEISKLRSDFHGSISTQTKWIATMIFAALAAGASIFAILKPPAPSQSPQLVYVVDAKQATPSPASTQTVGPQQPRK